MRDFELLYALAAQVMTVTKINPLALQLNEERMTGDKQSHTAVSIMHGARAALDALAEDVFALVRLEYRLKEAEDKPVLDIVRIKELKDQVAEKEKEILDLLRAEYVEKT